MPSGTEVVPVELTGSYFNGVEAVVVLGFSGVLSLLIPVECIERTPTLPCVSVVLGGTKVGSSSGSGVPGAKLTDLLVDVFVAESSPNGEAVLDPSPLVEKSTGTPVTSTGSLLPVPGTAAVKLSGVSVGAVDSVSVLEGPPSGTLDALSSVTLMSGLSIALLPVSIIGVVLGDLMRVRLRGVVSCGGVLIRDASKFEGAMLERWLSSDPV